MVACFLIVLLQHDGIVDTDVNGAIYYALLFFSSFILGFKIYVTYIVTQTWAHIQIFVFPV